MRLSLLFFFFLFSGLLPAKSLNSVTVSGEIQGYDDFEGPFFARVVVCDYGVQDQRNITTEISQDGTFKLQFELPWTQEFFLIYEDLITLIASPGDSLFVTFPAKKNMQEGDVIEQFVQLSGDFQKANYPLLQFRPIFNEKFGDFKVQSQKRDSLDWKAYKKYRLNRMEEELNFLQQYVADHQITDLLFLRWSKNAIRYKAGERLFFYGFSYHNKKRAENPDTASFPPEEYYAFLEKLEADNPAARVTSSYRYFLHYLQMYLRTKWQKEPVVKELLKSDGIEANRLLLETLTDATEGFAQDVVLSFFYESSLGHERTHENIEPYLNFFEENVENTYLKNRFWRKHDFLHLSTEQIKIDEAISAYELPDSITNVLPKILERNKGKVVYLDFWATWCGPCLEEFENAYPNFIPKFSDQEVAFVFLALNSPKNTWRKKIGDLKFEGEHYYLTQNQYGVLQDLFGIGGIPHHVLIDQTGSIIDQKAVRPGKDLQNQIKRLLE